VNGKSILVGRRLGENYQPWQSYPTNHWQSSHRQIEDISLHPEKWMKSVTSICFSKKVSSINIEMKTFRGLTEFQVDMTISEWLLILNRMFSPNSRKIWTKTKRITPKYTEYPFLRCRSRTEEIRNNAGLCEPPQSLTFIWRESFMNNNLRILNKIQVLVTGQSISYDLSLASLDAFGLHLWKIS